MALITRNAKGSPLTWTEMDDNLTYLESLTNIVDITYSDLMSLKTGNSLEPNRTYHITDSSQGDIWIKALDVDTLSTEVQKLFYVIPNDYYDGTIGEGMFNAHNPVDVTVGEIYIWGARLWECTVTATGVTQDDNFTLPAANFTMIPTSSSEYNKVIMSCQYDIDNDWISKAYDWKGNELGIDYSNQSTLQHIDYNDWGGEGIYNNVCGTILNNEGGGYINISNNKGYYGIWNNDSAGDGIEILNNVCGTISDNKNGYMYIDSNIMNVEDVKIINNDGIDSAYIGIYNNYVSYRISNNTVPVTYGISYNSINNGSINNNSNEGEIYSNSNNGNIQYNSNNGDIQNNSNFGHIKDNSNISGTTNIKYNTNNGMIGGNSMNGSYLLEYNNNNGDIGVASGTITRNADITDTKVDK